MSQEMTQHGLECRSNTNKGSAVGRKSAEPGNMPRCHVWLSGKRVNVFKRYFTKMLPVVSTDIRHPTLIEVMG